MKKLLIATTALVAGASAAAADVTISGYGRFGLQYIEDRGVTPGSGIAGTEEETQIAGRLRLNIDATTETDVGVTFGARLRLQNDLGNDTTVGNKARFSVGYEGLTVQVGNVDTAWDSVRLTYDSEMGFDDSSFGDAQNGFFAYNSKGADSNQNSNYAGVAAFYSIADVNLYFSYVDPDQTAKDLSIVPGLLANDEEIGLAADWSNGQISVAAGINLSSQGIKDNDDYFIGAAYNFGDGNVGLNYYDYNTAAGGVSDSTQVTLYGNYTFGATTLKAYVSDWDRAGYDTAYGIGADYSLGEGARISGSIQSGFGDAAGANNGTKADLGVRFDF
ncbi:porin [Rhodobacter sp. 24-YEA-8]|uniref:porin n=1 Tax=Rhodobacter sp. 24-YEA-8 TaxID=1884310 RepID=UPI00089AEB1D|nr:porin [Rhodobacter sp. 24-YEA-8]SEC53251.1 outer membrane protein OmpU [Rhodobacter sp. 24-YEA-8]